MDNLKNSDVKETSNSTFSVFGLSIHNLSMTESVDAVLQDNMSRKTVCFVNANSVNLSASNDQLKQAINDADLVFADGSGIRMAARRAGVELKANVNGTDMLPLLCQKASKLKRRMYLLGAAPGVAQQASDKLCAQFPGLQVSGTQDGYFSHEEQQSVIDHINESRTDILLVALGSPLQEAWIEENRHKLNVRVMLAVGGLFDFYSGRIPRAPEWMRKLGIEWLYRLLQEPKAKFKRYVIGNPLFVYRCMRLIPKTSRVI